MVKDFHGCKVKQKDIAFLHIYIYDISEKKQNKN